MTEAQVFSRQWAPPTGVLGRILAESVARVAAVEASGRRAIERAARDAALAPSLLHALTRADVGVIAEVKRRSPSKGSIRDSISAASQGLAYAKGGAAAVSVLTEPTHFGGCLSDLESTRAAVSIPLLRKDFIVDEIQLVEARAAGASAALLIVRALPPDRLRALATFALELDVEPLVEVRTERELQLALDVGARIIGINSRDLETLEVDAGVPERLVPLVPHDVIAIAESGVECRAHVEARARWGADAVLVGSVLSASVDPEAVVRELTGVARRARAH